MLYKEHMQGHFDLIMVVKGNGIETNTKIKTLSTKKLNLPSKVKRCSPKILYL